MTFNYMLTTTRFLATAAKKQRKNKKNKKNSNINNKSHICNKFLQI